MNNQQFQCDLPYEQLLWFSQKKPNLMPTGGWERLKELEAERPMRLPHWNDR